MLIQLLLVLSVFCQSTLGDETAVNSFDLNYVSHFIPNRRNPLKNNGTFSQHSPKLVGVLSEYPLSFYSVKDASGKVIRKEGVSPLIFWWVADRYGFDAELLERTASIPFDQNTSLPISYLDMLAGRMNVNLGFFVMTQKRNRFIDFTQPFFFEPLTLILPYPSLNIDVWSVWKAFQLEVWIGILVSILILYTFFRIFQHYPMRRVETFRDSFSFIVEVLLNQGSYCYSPSLGVRLLAGAWCLAACVLVNTYNSTLTAHLLINRPQPLIKSIYDLPENPNVQLLVKKGSGTDFLFSTTEKGFYKQLGDMLQSNPLSRCSTDKECLKLVRTGSYVYANPEFAAFDAMANEYKTTRTCEFTVIREYSLAISMAYFTLKSSPVWEPMNCGILSMKSFGIIDQWIANHRPTLSQCPSTNKLTEEKERAKEQVTAKHLIGAFVALAIGYCLAFFAFVGEILIHRCFVRHSRKRRN